MCELISKLLVWGSLAFSLIGIGIVLYTEEKTPPPEPVQKTVSAEEVSRGIQKLTEGLEKLSR